MTTILKGLNIFVAYILLIISLLIAGCGNDNTTNIVGAKVSESSGGIKLELKSDKETAGLNTTIVFSCNASRTDGGVFTEGKYPFVATNNGKLDPASASETFTIDAGKTFAGMGFHFTTTAKKLGTAQFTCTFDKISITKSVVIE